MTLSPSYELLGNINQPGDLRRLPQDRLEPLAAELRRYLIETLARVGGHFAANLGTVELTLALHYVFDTPNDRLIWDVGHQAYPHKILTGRRAQLETIRRKGGLAPFTSRQESAYDVFGAGHSSTSLSAAAGIALAVRHKKERRRVVAVIGDGGMTAGMAFEALNHIGRLGLDVIIVYNDNDMSISENVGALRDHAARVLAGRDYRRPDATGAAVAERPAQWRLEQRPLGETPALGVADGAFFETLGIRYYGPFDGHDLPTLIEVFEALKDHRGPCLLHVATIKGKGFEPAEREPIKYHGVTSFDPVTGEMPKKSGGCKSYTEIFGEWLCEAAAKDPLVVGITPAMREGSGLVEFARRFPDRYFDVAIAEQHAVTLGAGLAAEGLKPVVAIYSTFLQRGYDQLIHDVAVQNLPVLFALDRGGLVGPDGATHHGAFDLSFLRCLPNLVVMAPSDENECRRMLTTGLALKQPSAVRYPRGSGLGVEIEPNPKPLALGKARIVRQAIGRRQPRVAILAFGALVKPALDAAEILDASVVDMRFIKPLDEAMILDMANENDLIVTVEDNVVMGGAGSAVNEVLLAQHDTVAVLNLGLPDQFVEHGGREELLADLGLDAAGIQRSIQKRLRSRDLDQRVSSAHRA
ncbi:MAG TPA: 1-deoxy-D-xylulose-5-phosphate synthase [Nevskiales bacterium]|nr:1-deoxy-D-xylulose-5-phosphate synthase [Nevskiales bacterium]